ncbi:hypothetical protein GC089_14915 [Cellulomonas sp. JZ18]|uniref:CAP domain-containing protein n=1 Tax=Cellulomonas sp. JZ18 TaxID=2654191 RepID=UPI0012D43ABD|nr:CAP domain-containing protein [Cellulomonas sp. JZ18]QGQ20251.1 hypothetical protein GC089_14915 [Cellulomonas sp. JZ18]
MARDLPAREGRGTRAPSPLAAALFALAAALGVGAVLLARAPTDAPPAPTASTSPTVVDLTGVDPDDYARDLLAATTAQRETAGLPAWDAATCAADVARTRAQALVGRELEHAPLDDVLAACAPRSVAAENLSRAAADPRDVAEAWMGSPGHRANVVDPGLDAATVACTRDDGQMLCSLVLVGP